MQYNKVMCIPKPNVLVAMIVDNDWLFNYGEELPGNMDITLLGSDADTVIFGQTRKEFQKDLENYVEKVLGPGISLKSYYKFAPISEQSLKDTFHYVDFALNVKYPLSLSSVGLKYAKENQTCIDLSDLNSHYSSVIYSDNPVELGNMVLDLAAQGIALQDDSDGGLSLLVSRKYHRRLASLHPAFNAEKANELLANKDKIIKRMERRADKIKKIKKKVI